MGRNACVVVCGEASAPSTLPTSPIVGRERLILSELAHGDATVTFTGLRRRLGIHPQALTRSLRRLEADGDVAADEDGYRVTEQGHAALHDATPPETETTELVRLLLSPDVAPEDVEALLAGRWFDGLRWYGRAGGPGETVLLWTTEPDGDLVRVRIVGGALIIEVEASWDEAGPAFAALRSLLVAVADVFGRPV